MNLHTEILSYHLNFISEKKMTWEMLLLKLHFKRQNYEYV